MKKITIFYIFALFLSFLPQSQASQAAVSANTEKPQLFDPNYELQKIYSEIPGGGTGRVRLINANHEAWYARWNLISEARRTIDVTYFILQKDIFGMSFLGLLLQKAREGVKIRLMVDARMMPLYFRPFDHDELQELVGCPGVQIRLYNQIPQTIVASVEKKDLRMLSTSNHDKILIIDNKISITGGRNLGGDYFAQPGELKIAYYDSDVILDGPEIAKDLYEAFESEWKVLSNYQVKADFLNFRNQSKKLELARMAMENYMKGAPLLDPKLPSIPDSHRKIVEEFNAELMKFKKIQDYKKFTVWRGELPQPVRILDKESILGHKDQIGFNLQRFINAAKHEIVIQNPYVVLTKEAWNLMSQASKRGVRIIMHTNGPKSIDAPEALAFFCKEWAEMMRDMPTLQLFMAPSDKHQLHSKVIVIDWQIAVIGTYNLDPLSMVINSEVVAAINNREFATMVRLRVLNATKTAIECQINRNSDGSTTKVRGPEQDISPEIQKKINFLMKLDWLRPLL
ncbi:MAG: phosphatidylserine/phosphatidylglycerophosphate/cardiolipin synthase family protein [Candidatus Riflebacteria bacterium]|nr:phosphatidylserine/phosphatidylglycerophosphate/cardiolipin synthase family protein [Candidatus Riflebacteria bacterium]